MPKKTGLPNSETGRFGLTSYLRITVFGFGLSALWGGLHTIILPLRLLDLVSESQKNSYLGLLTFSGLVIAMLVQPLAGVLSDHATFSWGRRRPYILAGTVCALIILPGIGLFSRLITLYLTYCLLQVSTNTAQGPYQAFIPDLVPTNQRGQASGIKGLLEILGGVALLYPAALFMDRYSAGRESAWIWLVLGVPGLVLAGTTLATIILVKEPLTPSRKLRWQIKLNFSFKKHRGFIWFLLSRSLFFLTFTTLQTFALYFLRDVVGVASPATATANFSIAATSGMLLSVYPAGKISDRLGRRPIGITAGLIGALGIALIFMFQHSFTLILFSSGLLGISFGTFLSTNWALATDLIPRGKEAQYLGLANLAAAGGSALARLNGPIIDHFNMVQPDLGYSAMLLVCFASLCAGSLLLAFWKAG